MARSRKKKVVDLNAATSGPVPIAPASLPSKGQPTLTQILEEKAKTSRFAEQATNALPAAVKEVTDNWHQLDKVPASTLAKAAAFAKTAAPGSLTEQVLGHPKFVAAFKERVAKGRGAAWMAENRLTGLKGAQEKAGVDARVDQAATQNTLKYLQGKQKDRARIAGMAPGPQGAGLPGDVSVADLREAAGAVGAVGSSRAAANAAGITEQGVAAGLTDAAGIAPRAPGIMGRIGTALEGLPGKVGALTAENPLAAVATHAGWKRYMEAKAVKAAARGAAAEPGLIGGISKFGSSVTAKVLRGFGHAGRFNTAMGAVALSPLALGFAKDIADVTKRRFSGAGIGEPSFEDQLRAREALAGYAMQEQARQRRLQAYTDQNTQLIMSQMPELANQLLAGRELPQGAVVIGGDPNVGLLQRVASRMTQGAYTPDEQQGAGIPGM